ncbi:MAG: hypothetical protein MZV70_07410 [Desulfobacterales bacterium]|nr:hypothetical protein [Desulfobacterales bacterium]
MIKTKPGDVFLAKNAADDLKAVYGMGYFDDVQIQSEREPDGIRLVFKVTEKPTVRADPDRRATSVFDEDEITQEPHPEEGLDPEHLSRSATTCGGSRRCTRRRTITTSRSTYTDRRPRKTTRPTWSTRSTRAARS